MRLSCGLSISHTKLLFVVTLLIHNKRYLCNCFGFSFRPALVHTTTNRQNSLLTTTSQILNVETNNNLNNSSSSQPAPIVSNSNNNVPNRYNKVSRHHRSGGKSHSGKKGDDDGLIQKRKTRLKRIGSKDILKPLYDVYTPKEMEHIIKKIMINNNGQSSATQQLSSHDATELIRILASRGAYTILLQLMHHEPFLNIHSYTAAITTLAQSKNPTYRSEALNLFHQLPMFNLKPNSFTFTASFLAVDTPQQLLELLQLIDIPKSIYIYNAAIQRCSLFENTTDGYTIAMKLYNDMKQENIVPNEHTYNSLFYCCACACAGTQSFSSSNVKHSSNVKQTMISLLSEMKIQKIIPADRAWGAMLSTCASLGAVREAITILETMKKWNCTINVLHYNTYLATLAKMGKDEMAFKTLEEVLESGKNKDFPDLITLNTVLGACAKNENYDDAKQLLNKMKNGDFFVWKQFNNGRQQEQLSSKQKKIIYPDIISYNTVLSACRDVKEVLEIVQEIRMSSSSHHHHQHLKPLKPTSITYTNAISVCRKSTPPSLKTAQQLFDMAVKDDKIKPNVYLFSSLIWTAERCGDYHAAVKILNDMKQIWNQTPNAVLYDGVFSALIESRMPIDDTRTIEVLTLFREMNDDGIAPTLVTFRKLAQIAHECQSSQQKIRILEEIRTRMTETERRSKMGGAILESLIRAHAFEGNYDSAKRVFDCLTKCDGVITLPEDGPCVAAMLHACTVAVPSKWKEAIEMIERIRYGTNEIDSTLLSYVVTACCKENQWEEALDLIERFGYVVDTSEERHVNITKQQRKDKAVLPISSMNAIIATCGRCGRPDISISILNDMSSKYGIQPDERSYRSTIIACNQAEHEWQRHSRRKEDHWNDANPNDYYYSTTTLDDDDEDDEDHSLQLHWWECALSLFRRMREENLTPDPQTYSSVISACEAAGQWQRAIGVLQIMNKQNEPLNLFCVNAAISACEKGGAWVEAVELYQRIISHVDENTTSVRPNFITVNSLLIALEKAGQRELAGSIYEEAVRDGIVSPWKNRVDVNNESVQMLDLHQFSAPMAKIAVSYVIESLLNRKPLHDKMKDLVIIAGKGKGSEGGESVLMPLVLNLLKGEYGIEASIEKHNVGRIRVLSDDLCSFVERKGWVWDETVEESV